MSHLVFPMLKDRVSFWKTQVKVVLRFHYYTVNIRYIESKLIMLSFIDKVSMDCILQMVNSKSWRKNYDASTRYRANG